jgi:transposase
VVVEITHYGLLNNSFQPVSEIRVLRSYWRQRADHVGGAATCIQRMQKALTQMNVQLANVISDISGLTGPAIVRAIVAGERDTQKLAALSHPRIQARQEEIAQSLEGNWRPELIFVVQQGVDMYDTYQKRIVECDQQLQKQLASLMSLTPPGIGQTQKPKSQPPAAKNALRFGLSSELQRVTGVDLTRIDGIDVRVAQTLVSEVGLDRSRWKTESHFASW